jgi:Ca2+/H+ antiporter
MPLTACPDCGREVSTAAPACIHCGRPLVRTSKPMAGIVTAMLLGVLSIVLAALFPVDRYTPLDVRQVQWFLKGAHVLGNVALLAGVMMSLGGQPRGNRVVRAVSRATILLLLLSMGVLWTVLGRHTHMDGGPDMNWTPLVITVAVILTAPWLLYLFLFRKSRYP